MTCISDIQQKNKQQTKPKKTSLSDTLNPITSYAPNHQPPTTTYHIPKYHHTNPYHLQPNIMLIGLILLAIALTEFFLGLYFIFRYEKQQSTMWWGLFFIGASIYVGANGVGFLWDNLYFAERFGWAGGALATSFFLPFSFSFPTPQRSVRELLPWVVWPIIVFGFGSLFTNLFIEEQGIISYREGYQTAAGKFFWLYILFFTTYWVWAIANLVKSFLRSDGIHRWILKIILIGILTSLLVSTIFDITLPLISKSRFGYLGSLFTSVWVLFTGYILVAKK